MGFTALDGLPMGTRTGAIDSGVLLYLQRQGMSLDALEQMLYQESGLLGMSGLSSDMRVLLASEAPAARHAVDVFVWRIVQSLGAMAASLGGLDALVFTAGIGEHAAEIRARVCQAAAWMGIALDTQANDQHARCISRAESAVSVWVIPTDEDAMIAEHTRKMIDSV